MKNYKLKKLFHKKYIKFDDTEIEKHKFRQYKSPISIDNIDANKMVVSDKISFGKIEFKYFVSYKDAKKIRPFCIFLPKMSTYKRDFDKTKCISFLIKDTNSVYNKKYIKIKIKSHNGRISKPKKGSHCVCLSVIFIDSVYKTDKNCYPQMLLEKCKYVIKEK